MPVSENVVLVDEQDQVLGVEEKMQAHKLGKLHRAFSVFLFRQKGEKIELLLQQRQHDKYHCGGLWTNTCCSHPRLNEDVIDAGKRRLLEEMNISAELFKAGDFVYRAEFENGLIEHEFDHTLIGIYNQEVINVNPEEVSDYRWVTIGELESELELSPQLFTPWFPKALKLIQEKWSRVETMLEGAVSQEMT